MITEHRLAGHRPAPEKLPQVPTSDRERLLGEQRQQPTSTPNAPGLLRRLILAAVGFGLALVGWVLALSVFLSFIGLPLFIFGLALMQAQER
jgi:hypothetical protein